LTIKLKIIKYNKILRKSLKEILAQIKKFSAIKVLVIGDVMLDRYHWGSVSRISPEAPVPIVALEKSSVVAGGAANVAANVAGLGGQPILFGITGDDEDAKVFPDLLRKTGVREFKLFKIKNRPTTVKTRIIAHNQQIARIDQESTQPLLENEAAEILRQMEKSIEMSDVIIISDYAKGFLTDELLLGLITIANQTGKSIVVDPKGKDFTKYKGATILTPNQKEVAEACHLENTSDQLLEASGRRLLENLSLKALLITQGENGIKLLEKDRETVQLKATARNVYDVTGAGDTVIASLAVCMAAEMSFYDSSAFANFTAGIVVEHLGTTAINSELLHNSLK
jgi:rfaE bifunctional protein kinase chain/domain